MSGSLEQDDTYSGSEMDHGVDELANSLESSTLGMEATKVHVRAYILAVLRKPAFRVSDRVRHKRGCTATEEI